MSYMHLNNLYKQQEILMFKECYAMEKIHGTSAHIAWRDGALTFFSGGEKHDPFVALFDIAQLTAAFTALGQPVVTVYGEAYGGKCQGMSATYGKQLKFVAFEVMVGTTWLKVPDAADVVAKLGLEFVYYTRIPATVEAIDAERDAPSVQAVRNGIATLCIREGVVLRPLVEVILSNGGRVMAKHKRAEFTERKTVPKVDSNKHEILLKASAIATEWVTPMRLAHVLDKMPTARDYKDIPEVIKAMLEDIEREAAGEIVMDNAARRAIGGVTVKLFKEFIYEKENMAGLVQESKYRQTGRVA